MKATELRSKKEEDLRNLLVELKEEHFRMRFQKAIGQLENHRRIRGVKQEIARILTVMKERGINPGLTAKNDEAEA